MPVGPILQRLWLQGVRDPGHLRSPRQRLQRQGRRRQALRRRQRRLHVVRSARLAGQADQRRLRRQRSDGLPGRAGGVRRQGQQLRRHDRQRRDVRLGRRVHRREMRHQPVRSRRGHGVQGRPALRLRLAHVHQRHPARHRPAVHGRRRVQIALFLRRSDRARDERHPHAGQGHVHDAVLLVERVPDDAVDVRLLRRRAPAAVSASTRPSSVAPRASAPSQLARARAPRAVAGQEPSRAAAASTRAAPTRTARTARRAPSETWTTTTGSTA